MHEFTTAGFRWSKVTKKIIIKSSSNVCSVFLIFTSLLYLMKDDGKIRGQFVQIEYGSSLSELSLFMKTTKRLTVLLVYIYTGRILTTF